MVILPHPMYSPTEANLSQIELETVIMIACGFTNQQIADARGLNGHRTIDTHRANAMKKIAARGNMDLTRWALQWGFVHLDGTPAQPLETTLPGPERQA